jgi:hypothetical protein
MTDVSRVTIVLPDGQKACVRCRRRPRAPRQRYCQICRTEYNWQRRQGMIEVLLTPAEREMVLRARAAAADR